MLFYTALIIASLIVALLVLWAFQVIARAGRSVFKSRLPDAKNASTSHLRVQRLATTVNETPTPWGWKSHETPANMAKTHAAPPSRQTQWGGSENTTRPPAYDNSGSTRRVNINKPAIGWPYREEKSELAGKAYKVSRKTKPRLSNLGTVSKPWGW